MKQACKGNQPIKLIIAQSHINIVQGGFQFKLNNDACKIIPYPTVEGKHIGQVNVTNEPKIELFCFFTVGAMVLILIAVKNRYLNFSALLKFTTTQNEPKGYKTS